VDDSSVNSVGDGRAVWRLWIADPISSRRGDLAEGAHRRRSREGRRRPGPPRAGPPNTGSDAAMARRFVFNRACFLRDAGGRTVRALGAMTDVTERKQASRGCGGWPRRWKQATELIIVLDLQGASNTSTPPLERAPDSRQPTCWATVLVHLRLGERGAALCAVAAEIHKTGSWSGRYKCRKKTVPRFRNSL